MWHKPSCLPAGQPQAKHLQGSPATLARLTSRDDAHRVEGDQQG